MIKTSDSLALNMTQPHAALTEGEMGLVADNSEKERVALDFFSPAESGRNSGITSSVLQKNQTQTQEVDGKSLLKSFSCHMPSVCCGHSSCTDPSCWETREDSFSPVTSTPSSVVVKRETEILPCD